MLGIRNVNKQLKEEFAVDELRIQGLLKKRKETLEQFLVDFFNKWNQEKETLYTKDKTVQTKPGKRRSFGDIFSICKYYYPSLTVRELRDLLYIRLPELVPNFRTSLCSQIQKRVWYKGKENQETAILNKEGDDEFDMTVEDWLNL